MTKQIIPHIHYFETIDSTNIRLKEAAANGAPTETIYVAKQQTAGRGRLGRSFFSPESSGLYLSILFRTQNIDLFQWITMACSVAVSKAIFQSTGIQTNIKWVNDLYLNNKKVGGILAESLINPENNEYSIIIGLGLNLYTPGDGFPEEISSIATSLFSDSPPDEQMKEQLLYSILTELKKIPKKGPEDYITFYKEHSNVLNKQVTLTQGKNTMEGTVTGFNTFGHLLFTDSNDNTHVISSGEVTLRFK